MVDSKPAPAHDDEVPAAPESGVQLKALGWKRDTDESLPAGVKADKSARMMLGAPIALPSESLQLLGFIFRIYNQGQTSSCVGWAIKQACQIRARVMAATAEAAAAVEELSAMGIYDFARMREKQRTGDAIADVGCFPRDAMYALSEDGIPPESVWPFDPAKINDEPPWDVDAAASAHRITEFYRIDSDGDARVHDIMNAIAQGYPVVFGTFVDTAYMMYSGGVVMSVNLNDSQGGGHMQTIVGYTTQADGSIVFTVLNQWDASWGENGLARVHQNVILDDASSDFYVVQLTKGTGKRAGEPAKKAA